MMAVTTPGVGSFSAADFSAHTQAVLQRQREASASARQSQELAVRSAIASERARIGARAVGVQERHLLDVEIPGGKASREALSVRTAGTRQDVNKKARMLEAEELLHKAYQEIQSQRGLGQEEGRFMNMGRVIPPDDGITHAELLDMAKEYATSEYGANPWDVERVTLPTESVRVGVEGQQATTAGIKAATLTDEEMRAGKVTGQGIANRAAEEKLKQEVAEFGVHLNERLANLQITRTTLEKMKDAAPETLRLLRAKADREEALVQESLTSIMRVEAEIDAGIPKATALLATKQAEAAGAQATLTSAQARTLLGTLSPDGAARMRESLKAGQMMYGAEGETNLKRITTELTRRLSAKNTLDTTSLPGSFDEFRYTDAVKAINGVIEEMTQTTTMTQRQVLDNISAVYKGSIVEHIRSSFELLSPEEIAEVRRKKAGIKRSHRLFLSELGTAPQEIGRSSIVRVVPFGSWAMQSDATRQTEMKAFVRLTRQLGVDMEAILRPPEIDFLEGPPPAPVLTPPEEKD